MGSYKCKAYLEQRWCGPPRRERSETGWKVVMGTGVFFPQRVWWTHVVIGRNPWVSLASWNWMIFWTIFNIKWLVFLEAASSHGIWLFAKTVMLFFWGSVKSWKMTRLLAHQMNGHVPLGYNQPSVHGWQWVKTKHPKTSSVELRRTWFGWAIIKSMCLPSFLFFARGYHI